FLQRYVWVSHFVFTQSLRILPQRQTASSGVQDQATFKAFSRIASASKKLNLMRVSTKNEAALRIQDPDTRMASDFLASVAIPYDTCTLFYDEFMPYDGHPNAQATNASPNVSQTRYGSRVPSTACRFRQIQITGFASCALSPA